MQQQIADLLKGTGRTLSTAESCTGGNISHLITTVSGSSEYYVGSVISYAVAVKENVLGVKHETVENNGVVSSEVAFEMAEGVRRVLGTTFSVSITGLAGKDGDDHYPGGTAWIGISGPKGTRTSICHCDNDRKGNIDEFTNIALNLLKEYIEEC